MIMPVADKRAVYFVQCILQTILQDRNLRTGKVPRILPGGIPTRFIETVVSLIVSSLVFQGKTEIIDRFSVVWIRITFL